MAETFTRQATHPAEESSARHLRFRRHQATAHAFLPQRPEMEFPGSGIRGTDPGSSFLLDARPAPRSVSMLATLAVFAPASHASESHVNARVCNAIGMRELRVKHILHLRTHFRAG
jgi:hypothetical protein